MKLKYEDSEFMKRAIKHRRKFMSSPTDKTIQVCIINGNIRYLNPEIICTSASHKYTFELPDMIATDQHESGRCVIFTWLNFLRRMFKYGNCQFSNNYIYFYHRFESAMFSLTEFARRFSVNKNDRFIQYLKGNPSPEGTYDNVPIQLMLRYGIVLNDSYCDTIHSKHTKILNNMLKLMVKNYFIKIHENPTLIDTILKQAEYDIYKVLCYYLGTPPSKIYFMENELTPLEFFDKYVNR